MGVQMQNRQSLGSELMKANWGERANDIPPVRTVINSGLPFAGGTDGTTSSSYRPFISIGWLVSGQTANTAMVQISPRFIGCNRRQATHRPNR
jgi:predicted amidohydrolase YtcJ